MNELLIASHVLLWIAVIVLALLGLALARQIGVLHARVAPAGALMTSAGPAVGEMTEALSVTTLNGDSVTVGGATGGLQLVLFISPTCPICKSLIPAALSLARKEKEAMLVFGSDGGDAAAHERYVEQMQLQAYPYVVSLELGMRYEVAKLPYALLIDQDGILRSKGLVNSREHLESLIESMVTGYVSIQDYVEKHGEAAAAEQLGSKAI